MGKSKKIGIIAGSNVFEATMLKNAIEHYLRSEYDLEPDIISSSPKTIARRQVACWHIHDSDEYPEYVKLLHRQVLDFLARGVDYIVYASDVLALDMLYDRFRQAQSCSLNFAKRSLYLNCVELYYDRYAAMDAMFIGPTCVTSTLHQSYIEAHTRPDIPVAQVLSDDEPSAELQTSMLFQSSDTSELCAKLKDRIERTYTRIIRFDTIVVTDFWTERVLLQQDYVPSFDLGPTTLSIPNTLSRKKPNHFEFRVYNAEKTFARYIAACAAGEIQP